MYANSVKYFFRKFINWERKGSFKVSSNRQHIINCNVVTVPCLTEVYQHTKVAFVVLEFWSRQRFHVYRYHSDIPTTFSAR